MITAERYQKLIMNLISLLEVDEQDSCFQQDGATTHTTNSTMQMSEFFGGRIISRNLWPPRSPDLSPPDLYLWGFFEGEHVQKQPTHTLEELKQNTELCISKSLQKLFIGLYQT
jgi:hypothetical protein